VIVDTAAGIWGISSLKKSSLLKMDALFLKNIHFKTQFVFCGELKIIC